ncbi:hypothetical protein DFH09DRAFT_1079392 [Mycena vulgaris]|nr:hypothetical protein DFH09DRAFT_1079392 [Mycena vulgaris]
MDATQTQARRCYAVVVVEVQDTSAFVDEAPPSLEETQAEGHSAMHGPPSVVQNVPVFPVLKTVSYAWAGDPQVHTATYSSPALWRIHGPLRVRLCHSVALVLVLLVRIRTRARRQSQSFQRCGGRGGRDACGFPPPADPAPLLGTAALAQREWWAGVAGREDLEMEMEIGVEEDGTEEGAEECAAEEEAGAFACVGRAIREEARAY